MIDAGSFEALRNAAQRDLLPEVRHAVAAGFSPRVVGVRRWRSGVAVALDLGDGVVVVRTLRLDPDVFDLRVRLGIVEQTVVALVNAAAGHPGFQSRAAQLEPLSRLGVGLMWQRPSWGRP